MSKRPSDASHTTVSLPIAGRYIIQDPVTGATEKFDAGVINNLRNALAARGGIAFFGATGARVAIASTSVSAIGSDPVSVHVIVTVPTANPAVAQDYFNATGSISAEGSAQLYLATDGTLRYKDWTAYPSTRYVFGPNLVTGWGGKTVHITITRSGGTIKIYINGVLQTTTEGTDGASPPADFSGSWGAVTYFTFGDVDGARPFTQKVLGWTLYNLCLSPADVVEIVELNGAVPERYKFGSQADGRLVSASYADAIRYGASDVAAYSSTGSSHVTAVTTPAGARTGGAGGYVLHVTHDGIGGNMEVQGPFSATVFSGLKGGQQIRIKGWMLGHGANISGSALSHQIRYNNAAADGALTQVGTHGTDDTWTAFSGIATVPAAATGMAFNLEKWRLTTGGGSSADYVELDDVQYQLLGAVCHLPLDDGYSYLLKDQSTNKLHGVMTATGVAHVIPQNRPHHIRGTTSTNGNQQAYGQVLIPANSRILYQQFRAQSGTPTVKGGNASGGAQLAASIALTSNWQDAPVVLPIVTADTSIWINSNSTDVVEFDFLVVPLSA